MTAWREDGRRRARDAALAAARHLLTRYHEKARIIQAWGDLDDLEQRGRTIIDSLMNTPLLFWASELTGDTVFAECGGRPRRAIARPHHQARLLDVPHLLLECRHRRGAPRRHRAGSRRRFVLGQRTGVGHLRIRSQLQAHRRRDLPRGLPPVRGLSSWTTCPTTASRIGISRSARKATRIAIALPGAIAATGLLELASACTGPESERYRDGRAHDPFLADGLTMPRPPATAPMRCCCTASTTSRRASASTRAACGATTSTWRR